MIGELIQSLKQQNYPAHLLDIYVVADNCTDDTAQVSGGRGPSSMSGSIRARRARATP